MGENNSRIPTGTRATHPQCRTHIRSSIENIPIELKNTTIRTFLSQYATQYPTPAGKTPHRGKRHENTYLITGTRIHYRTNIKEHLPKYLQIWETLQNNIR